jgi:hypothetical protein
MFDVAALLKPRRGTLCVLAFGPLWAFRTVFQYLSPRPCGPRLSSPTPTKEEEGSVEEKRPISVRIAHGYGLDTDKCNLFYYLYPYVLCPAVFLRPVLLWGYRFYFPVRYLYVSR